MRRTLASLIVLGLSASGISAQTVVGDVGLPTGSRLQRPDPVGTPTQVSVGVFVNDVVVIEDARQSYTADIWVTVFALSYPPTGMQLMRDNTRGNLQTRISLEWVILSEPPAKKYK